MTARRAVGRKELTVPHLPHHPNEPRPFSLTVDDDTTAKIAASAGWKPESVRARFSIVCWRGHDSVALLVKKEEVRELLRMMDSLNE